MKQALFLQPRGPHGAYKYLLHCVRKRSNPLNNVAYDKNAKYERILTKLHTFNSESIFKKNHKISLGNIIC